MKRQATFIVALATAFLSSGCTRLATSSETGRHVWTRPHVLRIADISDPDRFNPLLSSMDLVEDLSSLVLSYLVIDDGRGRLIGDLATDVPTLQNGGISRDGMTYTYHLRRGVRWHDGAPFSSHDVAFTWRAVMNPDNNVFHREGYDEVARVDTPDDATVVVHLRERYPPFVTKFFTTLQEGSKAILPEHLLAKYPNINQVPYDAAPVGTGPFKFVRWDRGSGIVLVRNDAYFKGRPKLERIEFKVIPDDNVIFNALRTHDIDLVVSASTAQFDSMRSLDGIVAALYPWNAVNLLAINDGRPGLRHLEVRRAVATAIDYQAIVAKVTHGVGELAHDIVPPTAIGYTRNTPYAYDPRAANAMLDRAGWRRGPDGIRAKDGERLDFTIDVSTGSSTARNVAVQVQAYLHAVGMNLAIKQYPYNVMFAHDGPVFTRAYDFADYSYTLPWDPDNTTYLGCDRFSPKGENIFAYCDPVVDAGERAALRTDDPVARAAIYHPVERRIHETVPYIPLYVPRRPTARSVDLRGFDPAPGIAPWWNAWQWDI